MTTMTRSFALLLMILALALCPVLGQSISGNLTGTVYDATGAIVPNATVIVRNDATGVENTTTTGATGEYRISNLPAGVYTITANAVGFSKAEMKGVNVELNVTATANVTLQVGKSVETVEVTARGGHHRYHHRAASEHF